MLEWVVAALVVLVLGGVAWGVSRVRYLWSTDFKVKGVPKLDLGDRMLVRDRFSEDKVRSMEFIDVIIVGSGIGALVTAALLSKVGMRVLILEQHDRAGGATHEWGEHGWEWDVGVHYIGGRVWAASETRALFDAVSSGRLGWRRLEGPYDVAVLRGSAREEGGAGWGEGVSALARVRADDVIAPMPPGRESLAAALEAYEDDETRGVVRRWMARTQAAQTRARTYFLARMLPTAVYRVLGWWLESAHAQEDMGKTVSEVLDEEGAGKNERLRFVLTYISGDHGMMPQNAPFGVHAAVAKHYWEGAAFPEGGAEQMARSAVATIREHGGRVLVNARVEELLVEGGRCVGVRLANGSSIRAPIVVSDAGASPTMERLVPAAAYAENRELREMREVIASLRPSTAHFQLFLGLDLSASEAAALPQCNYWIYNCPLEPAPTAAQIAAACPPGAATTFPILGGFLGFPSAKVPGRKPCAIFLTEARWEDVEAWQGTEHRHRGKDYDALKQAVTDAMLALLEQRFPALRKRVVYSDLGTPLSTAFYLASDRGASYGLAHDVSRFTRHTKFLRPATPLPGLWLTGQDVCTVGVAGAAIGGAFTAAAIAPFDVFARFGDVFGLWRNKRA
jgi:all-trans-retinol 13,14-reductase